MRTRKAVCVHVESVIVVVLLLYVIMCLWSSVCPCLATVRLFKRVCDVVYSACVCHFSRVRCTDEGQQPETADAILVPSPLGLHQLSATLCLHVMSANVLFECFGTCL